MHLRQQLLKAQGCRFDAEVTADYGTSVYQFTMQCELDQTGNLTFTVSAPETIAGITGMVSEEGGKLTFDGQALAFSMLADGQITPVSAPWLVMHTLRGGYISGAGKEGEYIKILMDDSYEENAMSLEILMDAQGSPSRGEILWKNRRIVTVDVKNFCYL